MIDINRLKEYAEQHKMFMSQHASNRCEQRNISKKDIKNCILTGEIIEQYPGDFPWPSCLIYGYTADNKTVHVVVSDSGEASKIITAYIPDTETFEPDLKTRKEK